MPLVSVDDLCTAAEEILREHTPALAKSKGLQAIAEWQQVPTTASLTSAKTPVAAVASPGLTEPPTRRSDGSYDATWRVVVGVFDRGTTHAETAARIRAWAAVVRQVLVQHPTLAGVSTGVTWVGEEYAERPERSSARTLGGCAVAFDVTARNVIDTEPFVPEDPDDPSAEPPVVTSTHRTITVRPPSQE